MTSGFDDLKYDVVSFCEQHDAKVRAEVSFGKIGRLGSCEQHWNEIEFGRKTRYVATMTIVVTKTKTVSLEQNVYSYDDSYWFVLNWSEFASRLKQAISDVQPSPPPNQPKKRVAKPERLRVVRTLL